MSSTTFEIEKLYIEFFNRPADAGGLQYWSNAANNGATITQIAHAMENSVEYHAAFTQSWNDGVASSVDHAFMNMFDRHASMAELSTWGVKLYGALVEHTPTSDVIMQIGDAAVGADLQHLMQKVTDAVPVQLVGVQTHEAVHAAIA
ncbi:DUF4214 domain-containing protein [Duganella violaceipulchra]|uniref:DUF4214 domain-containing protein n=1 Tax=Duganella violaceipulchra TaxID=2849652 RepID=A0AA41L949_9BURK|nr:DUF4214 domain-containing protein [Duganella violaceicalia]MBV6322870.1 DUF4214 domain-containing protein [Duganella violaceicalia]MCP2007951.1 hypothetical protein [Duganella violaceicalia]